MDEHETAERILARALEERGRRDPREDFRELLRQLRSRDAEAYDRAVAHYRSTLVPGIASSAIDPIEGWLEYGRMIASSLEKGRTVAIDGTGKAAPWEGPPPDDRLVLHLPDNERVKAIPVGAPAEPSPAQRSSWDLLVAGRQSLGA
jgi:hypothetical protein